MIRYEDDETPIVAARVARIKKGECVFCNSPNNLESAIAHHNLKVEICKNCLCRPSLASISKTK